MEHKLLLLKALRSPEVRVLWRSDIETFTQHRYIVEPWMEFRPVAKERSDIGIDDFLFPPLGDLDTQGATVFSGGLKVFDPAQCRRCRSMWRQNHA